MPLAGNTSAIPRVAPISGYQRNWAIVGSVFVLGWLWVLSGSGWAHDPKTQTTEEMVDRTHALLSSLRDSAQGEAPVPADSLRDNVSSMPEVRELIHLKAVAADMVMAEFSKAVGKKDQDLFVCALSYVLENSDHQPALPDLIASLEGAVDDSSHSFDFITQAIKALTRQPGQHMDRFFAFDRGERRRTLVHAREYVKDRAIAMSESLDSPRRLIAGASDTATFRASIASLPEVRALISMGSYAIEPLIRKLDSADQLRNADVAVSAYAYVLGQLNASQALPALIHFLQQYGDTFLFAPDFVTDAIKVITKQQDRDERYYEYDREERHQTLTRAREVLNRQETKRGGSK